MITVGKLARRFGLSRAALLYYDDIGLLRASSRSAGGYRLYSDQEVRRLEQICRFREAGLKLEEMQRVLDGPGDALDQALEARLEELNAEVERLRQQQRFILGLLKADPARRPLKAMSGRVWKSLLAAAGFTDSDLAAWHAGFERHDPEGHQRFLELLRIPGSQIAAIRARARTGAAEAHASPRPVRATRASTHIR